MRRLLLALLALGAPSCGHEDVFDLSGTWSGGSSTDHSARQVLTIWQDGRDITGLVCRISSGHRVFYDVPVSGRYPTFTFPYFGDTVTGAPTDENTIVAYRRGSVSDEMHFTRASSDDYEQCRSASP
jgi:hypothetical protein